MQLDSLSSEVCVSVQRNQASKGRADTHTHMHTPVHPILARILAREQEIPPYQEHASMHNFVVLTANYKQNAWTCKISNNYFVHALNLPKKLNLPGCAFQLWQKSPKLSIASILIRLAQRNICYMAHNQLITQTLTLRVRCQHSRIRSFVKGSLFVGCYFLHLLVQGNLFIIKALITQTFSVVCVRGQIFNTKKYSHSIRMRAVIMI